MTYKKDILGKRTRHADTIGKKRTFISFDWALKHLLREKANHDVLEGFVSTVLKKDIRIHRLLESESNKEDEDSKSNRVDLLAEDEHGDLLRLSPFQQQKFKADEVSDLYPLYVILKVNDFNRWSRDSLDQWLYFLANTDIPDDADAPGLREAREKLDLMRMSRDERIVYDRYLMDRAILRNTVDGARDEGKYEGMKEGLEQGRAEGRAEGEQAKALDTARRMKAKGYAIEDIAEITGLTTEEVDRLR